MNENSILTSPDDSGWYWFKKYKKDDVSIVFVDSDGICFAMDKTGESWQLEDQIGIWYPVDNP